MPVQRLLPTTESADLIELTRDVCRRSLAPVVDETERKGEMPRETYRTLGQAGRIEGVTPGALTALLAHVRRSKSAAAA